MQIIRKASHIHLSKFCLAGLLPATLMALAFHIPLASGYRYHLPGIGQALLGYVIHSSFLAAACGIVPLIPLLITTETQAGKNAARVAFVILGFICGWVARALAGTGGMVFYVLMVFVTYGGGTLFMFDWLFGVTRAFVTLLRWSVALFSYVTLQLHFDLPADIETWRSTGVAISFGATYFYLLALLEVVLYPPLTWYLERHLSEQRRYSIVLDGFGENQHWE